MDSRRRVTRSGVVVASTAARPGKVDVAVQTREFEIMYKNTFFFLEKEDDPRSLHLVDAYGHFINYSHTRPYKAIQQQD